jgi:hypothetical protein
LNKQSWNSTCDFLETPLKLDLKTVQIKTIGDKKLTVSTIQPKTLSLL